MELYILSRLSFFSRSQKVKIPQQIRITKAIFSILKPILPMSFHVVEKKHPKA